MPNIIILYFSMYYKQIVRATTEYDKCFNRNTINGYLKNIKANEKKRFYPAAKGNYKN